MPERRLRAYFAFTTNVICRVVMKTWNVVAIIFLTAFGSAAAQPRYDILIRGGRVLDGSGNPWFTRDVAIHNGRIVAVGRLDGASADRVINADGLYVSPGFIDMHSHANSGFDHEERRAKRRCTARSAAFCSPRARPTTPSGASAPPW